MVKRLNRTGGEWVGTPRPGRQFALLQTGMTWRLLNQSIGFADAEGSHITGKPFIPFYFGPDTRRTDATKWATVSPTAFLGQGEAKTLIYIIADPSAPGVAH